MIFTRRTVDLAIDLGTDKTIMVVPSLGASLCAPTALAVAEAGFGGETVRAVGMEAARWEGRIPGAMASEASPRPEGRGKRAMPAPVSVCHPVRHGMVVDAHRSMQLLQAFRTALAPGRGVRCGTVLISLPAVASDLERRAFADAAQGLGAKRVLMVPEPLAAAVGAGLDVMSPEGRMLVDVGSGIIEAVVIAGGHIVASASRAWEEDGLADGVARVVRKRFGFIIARDTVESVLQLMAQVAPGTLPMTPTLLAGKWIATGLPGKIRVPLGLLACEAVRAAGEKIAGVVREAFDACHPEVMGDLSRVGGIHMTGGGSQFPLVVAEAERLLKCPLRAVPDPLTAVARGNAIILADAILREAVVSTP